MQELINMANTKEMDYSLAQYGGLAQFSLKNGLSGIELMICGPVDFKIYQPDFIKGVHLWFWPSWLDFWLHDRHHLYDVYQLNSIKNIYGGFKKREWLKKWQKNFSFFEKIMPQYLVFHVAEIGPAQIRNRAYRYTDADVLWAAMQLVNILPWEKYIASDCLLLFENLWWPGLNFSDFSLAYRFLEGIKRESKGFLFDVGHFLNTSMKICNEKQANIYLKKNKKLFSCLKDSVQVIHLHYSASGAYTTAVRQGKRFDADDMHYILCTDEHRPFQHEKVGWLLQELSPRFLVHEFLASDCQSIIAALQLQRKCLA